MVPSPNKRKRTTSESYTIINSSRPNTEVGPVTATFPSIEPPSDTPFKCYYRDGKAVSEKDNVEFKEQNVFLVGESEDVDFLTAQGPKELSDTGCRYLIGVRSKTSNTITIRDCPLHLITREVKRLRTATTLKSDKAVEARMAQRAKLGNAFGTKKSQKAIRARERNQVDVTAMEGMLSQIGEGVDERTRGLPSVDEAKAIMDSSRLIPPHNLSADKVEDIYPISSIISEAELSSIKVAPFLSAGDEFARTKLLPFARSKFINSRIESLNLDSGGKITSRDRQRLQILIFTSALFSLRSFQHKLSDRNVLEERMKAISPMIIDGLIKRFTETARESNKPQITSEKETLLLTTLLALTLHIDKFVVDPSAIAKDLSLSVPKINSYYKSLGCKVEVPTATDCARLGVSTGALGPEKKAILRVPPTFPQLKTRGRKMGTFNIS